MQKNQIVDNKQQNKSRPVTEEELAAQQYLFEAAYNDIKGGQSRKEVVQRLAKDLADIGYDKRRIARAIVKKLTHDPLKITSDDYVRRVLGEEYKDYPQKEPERPVKKEVKTKPKSKKKDSELDIEKTKAEDGKEITTVYLKQPKKEPVEIQAEVKKKVVPSDKIQVDDLSDEAEVELIATKAKPAKASPTLEAKVRVLEDEVLNLKNENNAQGMKMRKIIDELNAQIEELERPYQQRQYVTVSLGQDTAIIGYFGVAMPKTKSMGVVKKSAIPLATVEEKNQDQSEWEKNLKPGRVSVDVNIGDSKAKSKSPESA